MKTFYCVTSEFYDNGTVKAAITNRIQAEEKPEDKEAETAIADVYQEWYDTEVEARKAVRDALRA
jgi:hypothetical protein